jgi:hypothetical protein
LNPVLPDGKMRYSINKKDSLAEMVIIAAHEVAHMASNYHDEAMARELTYLAIDCMKDASELYNRIKDAK